MGDECFVGPQVSFLKRIVFSPHAIGRLSAKLGVGVCAVADDADANHITIVHTHRVELAGGAEAIQSSPCGKPIERPLYRGKADITIEWRQVRL